MTRAELEARVRRVLMTAMRTGGVLRSDQSRELEQHVAMIMAAVGVFAEAEAPAAEVAAVAEAGGAC